MWAELGRRGGSLVGLPVALTTGSLHELKRRFPGDPLNPIIKVVHSMELFQLWQEKQ